MKPADETYKGDCLATVYEIVNTTLRPYGYEFIPEDELLKRYAMEEIVEIIASIPAADLPKCIGCESMNYLVPCKGCHQFVCADCRKDHCCGSGENVGGFEA